MKRLQIFQRRRFTILFRGGVLSMVTAMTMIETSVTFAAPAKKSKQAASPAEAAALRYIDALGTGNKFGVGQLDFACQYPLVTAAPHGIKTYPVDSDPVYDSCWQGLKTAHAPTLVRTDVGMEVSIGDLTRRDNAKPKPGTKFWKIEPLTFALTQKPNWMSIDADTGLITGTSDGTGGPVVVSVTLAKEHRLVHDKDNIIWGNEYEQSKTYETGGARDPAVCRARREG